MKSLAEYNEERFSGLFLLRNDNDFADVVFGYKSFNDVMVDDVHYIKSHDYTGYVKCCGKGCPACAKGIRVQTKIPIPIYNITEQELQIWDRNISFQYQISNEIFANYPNPNEVIFRIVRHGASGDINTKYEITARGINTSKETGKPLYDFDSILAQHNTSIQQMYLDFCKDYSIEELSGLVYNNTSTEDGSITSTELPDYKVTPRNFNSVENEALPDTDDVFINLPDDSDDDDFTEF